jgi:hypothetical protein
MPRRIAAAVDRGWRDLRRRGPSQIGHRFRAEVSGAATLYALAGMGAVAAAVPGAPISTTLIVFELTGDWQTGLAVMVAVSMSTALASRPVRRPFFLTQLERRGAHIAAGPQAYLLSMFRVANIMRQPGSPRAAPDDAIWEAIEAGATIDGNATLDAAMPLFERTRTRSSPSLRWAPPESRQVSRALSITWTPCAPAIAPWPPPRPMSIPDPDRSLGPQKSGSGSHDPMLSANQRSWPAVDGAAVGLPLSVKPPRS